MVTYNIDSDTNGSGGVGTPGSGLATVLQAIGQESLNGNARPINVLALQELSWTGSGPSSTLQIVVNDLNSIYGAGTYAYDPTYDPTDGDLTGNGPSGLIYNTKTIADLGAESIGTVSGSCMARAPMRYELQPVDGNSSSAFYLYVSHAKQGTGTSNENRRNQEAQEIVADAASLGPAVNHIYCGDFNFDGSSEPSYQTYIAAGNGKANDPANPVGNWTESSAFTGIFTETATALQYRDDAQLVSSSVLNGTGGLQLVSGNYTAFGNDGTTLYKTSVNQTSNTALSDLPDQLTVLAALTTATDHLPVVADYTFTAVPEPGTGLMAIVATAILAGLAWRRHDKA